MHLSSYCLTLLCVSVTFSSVHLSDIHGSNVDHSMKLTVTPEPTKVKEEIEDKNSVDKVTLDCDEKNPDCIKDRVGLDAIIYLHGLIDDDHNGNVDQSESDEFFRDELKYTDGFERLSIFHGNDKLISVGDLWQAWKKSQVYNWTVDDVAEWMVKHVELKQYVNNFKSNNVDGPTLPRLAVPDHNYMSNVLGVKNGVHRQKISVKAMDLVLFGPPKEIHNYLKDLALILSLVIALGGCWFAYMQHKYSKTHMKRMLTEMENLQKAEESLLQLQDKLKNAQQEQESVYEEKKSLEQKYHDEIETAKREAERLKKAREGSMEEISRLKLAEEELAQVRVALRRAEKELERNQWSAPTELKLWLQLTHEMEVQYFNNKKREAEKYFIAARDECDKVRKKRGTFLGPLRVAHSNSIDTVDQHIDEARTKLEEVRCILQERLQRWNRIEHICGFPIVSNPGLDNLQQILHRDVDIAGSNKYSPSLLANIDVEDAELDEDPPPGYPQAAMLFHSTLANGLPRPPPYPAGYPPGLHRRPQQLSSSTIPRPQPKKTTSLGSMRSGRSETSPTTSSPNGVSERPVFTLDASSPESPVSPVIPAEHLESQVGLLNLKMATMPRSQTTSIISASVLSKRDSQGNTSLPASSSSVTSSVPMEKRSQSDADLLHSMKCGVTHMGNFDSLEESDSGSNSLGVNGHTKKKKLKMPKFFSRKDKQKTS